MVYMLVHFCVYASLCLCCIAARVNILKNTSLPAVMAFGDSFMDAGNNNDCPTLVKANFAPYGKDFKDGKATGRFTNGKTIGDYFVGKLGVKDYLPAYLDSFLQDDDMLNGVSFSSGGSGLDPLTSKLGSVFSLPDQLEMFKEYILKLKKIVGEQEANEIIRNSLYLVSWSSNDWITYTVVRSLHYDEASYANMLVEMAKDFIKQIYELGARKIAFFNTPTIGCVPLARTVAGGKGRVCGDKFNDEAQTFNSMLKHEIKFLGSNLPQSRFANYFNIVEDIIVNRHQYGLEVVDRGCCGTGAIEVAVLCNELSPTCLDDSKFLYWDSVHLTDKGYNIVVDHALRDMMNVLV